MTTITLNQPDKSYAPGDSIEGMIEWTKLNAKTDRFEIRLIWYTEGKGDTDVKIIDAVTKDSLSSSGKQQFSFIAPTRPFSFSGKLISLIWAIEFVEFPSRDGVRETLVISSNRNEILLDKSFEDDSIAGKLARLSPR